MLYFYIRQSKNKTYNHKSLREPWMPMVKQRVIPSLWKLGHWGVFQKDNKLKNTSKSTSDLQKKLRFEMMARPSTSPGLNPIEHWRVIWRSSSNQRWRRARSPSSTISMTSSWRSRGGIWWKPVKLWWAPGPRGRTQCWKLLVTRQNTDIMGPVWTIYTCIDVLSYFDGTVLLLLLLLHFLIALFKLCTDYVF